MKLTKKTLLLLGLLLSVVLVVLLLPFGARFFRDTEALKAEHLRQGQDYFAERRFEAAIIEWKNALQADPEFALAYYHLGKAYMEQGLIKPAFATLTRSVNLNPDLLDAQIELGNFYALVKSEESLLQAEQIAKVVIGKDPQKIDAHLLLSHVALGRNQIDTALEVANHALELQPDHLKTKLQLANLYWRLKDLEQAENSLKQVISQHDTLAEPYFQLGRFYQFTQRVPEAESLLRQAVEVEPDNARGIFYLAKYFDLTAVPDSALHYMRQANEVDPEVLIYKKHLAFYLIDRGDVEEGTKWTDEVQRYDPDDFDGLYFQGRLQLLRGDNKDALDTLEKVSFQDIDYAFDWYIKDLGYFLAVAFQRNGQLQEAAQALNLIEPAAAQRPRVQVFQVQLNLALGNGVEALALIRKLRQDQPDNTQLAQLEAQALVQSADPAEQQRGLNELIGQLQTKIAQEPENQNAAIVLSNYLLQAKRVEEAEKVLTQAIDQQPESGDLRVVLGNFYFNTGSVDQAEAHYLAAIEQDPQHHGAYHQLGQYYAVEGDLTKAQQYIEKSLELEPEYLPAQKNLAFIQLQQNEIDSAEEFAQRLLKQRGDDPDGLYLQGLIQLNRGEEAQTLDSFLRIRSTNPDYRFSMLASDLKHPMALAYFRSGQFGAGLETAEAILSTEPNNLNALLLKAHALMQLERLKPALDAFNKVIELYPESLSGYYGAGEIYMRQGKAEEAFKAFDYILETKPDEVRALDFAVRQSLATDQTERALQYCRDQLAHNPKSGIGHYWQGRILLKQGNIDAAELHFQEALALDDKQPRWHFSLAGLYLEKEDFPKAQSSYERALELAPKYAAAANNLAWLLAETGTDLGRAQRLATMAQRLAPDNPQILDTLGWIHLKSRSYGAAIRLFEKGISSHPEEPILHYRLGLAYMRDDDIAAARQSLEKSLNLNPVHDHADSAQIYLAQLGQQ